MTEHLIETDLFYHRDLVIIKASRADVGDVIHVIENRRLGTLFHTMYEVVLSQRTRELTPRFTRQWLEH